MALFEGYKNRGTSIERLDPRTKLSWLILIVILAVFNSNYGVLALLPVAVLLSSLAAGIPLRTFYHPFLVLGLAALQLLVIQLLFCREGYPILALGPLEIYSGAVPLALTAVLRLGAIVLAGMQFLHWTSPSDLVLFLVKVGVPYRFAMLAGLAMRFLPLMEHELASILESQSARGVPMQNPFQKIAALLPVTMPFLFRSFRRAGETALAMELRGFGRYRERTFLDELRISRGETFAILLMAAAGLLIIYYNNI